MRDAKEKTTYEREKLNKERKKKGMEPLPNDSFESEYQDNLR